MGGGSALLGEGPAVGSRDVLARAGIAAELGEGLCVGINFHLAELYDLTCSAVLRLSCSDDLKKGLQHRREIVAMPCDGQVAHHSLIPNGSIDDPLPT